MCLFKWADKLIKKMKLKWYDMSLVKLSVMFATFFLMTAWTGFRNLVLSVEWHWYLIITLILMAPLLKKMFLDK